VLEKEGASEIESFENGNLEYPQYTRPENYRGMKVPDVLLSGNHAEIEKWRKNHSKKVK
jgi:tRNA (guanine37-N1)-methyltransferase